MSLTLRGGVVGAVTAVLAACAPGIPGEIGAGTEAGSGSESSTGSEGTTAAASGATGSATSADGSCRLPRDCYADTDYYTEWACIGGACVELTCEQVNDLCADFHECAEPSELARSTSVPDGVCVPADRAPECVDTPAWTTMGLNALGGIRAMTFTAADGDGLEDLVLVYGSRITIHPGPWGSAPVSLDLPPGVVAGESVATGDLDGTGTLDLVVAGQADTGIGVLLRTGDHAYVPGAGLPTGNPGRLGTGDVDGDGAADVLTAWAAYNQLAGFWLSDGSGGLGTNQTFPWNGVALGDLNGDGRVDAAGCGNYFLSSGTGFPSMKGQLVSQCFSVAVGDHDGDGDLDVALPRDPNGWVQLVRLENDGNGQLVEGVRDGLPERGDTWPVTADLDGDGRDDLVYGGDGTSLVAVRSVDGLLDCFEEIGLPHPATMIAAGDIDGDMADEIVISNGNEVTLLDASP